MAAYDPETEEPHIYRHGVDEDDAEDVLRCPLEARPWAGGARVAIGQTRPGRYLRVIDVPASEPGSLFVITAYDLDRKPLQVLRRRLKKKP